MRNKGEIQLPPAQTRPSYGYDAPYLLPVPIVLILVGVVQGTLTNSLWPYVGAALVAVLGGLGLYASRQGKFLVWSRLLDGLDLRGDERALDIGCGRGAVLVLMARRLTSGRATGIDIWNRRDQSGNDIDITQHNAELEGVADRVVLKTASMVDLPFEAGSFDVVVSSLAVHNVKGRTNREQAVDEVVRVLHPGGRLVIADILGTRKILRRLNAIGMDSVERRGLGWQMCFGGLPTSVVTATKPST